MVIYLQVINSILNRIKQIYFGLFEFLILRYICLSFYNFRQSTILAFILGLN